MKYVLTFALLGIAIAGCSSSTNGIPPTAIVGHTLTETEGAPTSASAPLVKARPPAVFLGPPKNDPPAYGLAITPTSVAGWQTFTSSSLGVVVEYPADWSVNEQAGIITFGSSQGASVLLQAINKDEQALNQGGDCTSITNSHGLTGTVCMDAGSSTYSATFDLESANRSARWLELSTTGAQALDVYKLMFNSLRFSS